MADAFWVHGNAAQLLLPSDLKLATVTRQGFAVTAEPDKYGWIVISLATPTVVNDAPASLTEIYVDIDTPQGEIDQIEVYDGANMVWAAPNGVWGSTLLVALTLPKPHLVRRAIALSIHYGYNFAVKGVTTPPKEDPARLTIYAAGARYTYPDLDTLPLPPKKP